MEPDYDNLEETPKTQYDENGNTINNDGSKCICKYYPSHCERCSELIDEHNL